MKSDEALVREYKDDINRQIEALNKEEKKFDYAYRIIKPPKYFANEFNTIDVITSGPERKDYIIAQISFWMPANGYAEGSDASIQYLEAVPYEDFEFKNTSNNRGEGYEEFVLDPYTKKLEGLNNLFRVSSNLFASQTESHLNSVHLNIRRHENINNSNPVNTMTFGSSEATKRQTHNRGYYNSVNERKSYGSVGGQQTMNFDSPAKIPNPDPGPTIRIDEFKEYLRNTANYLPTYFRVMKRDSMNDYENMVDKLYSLYVTFHNKYPNAGINKFLDQLVLNLEGNGQIRFSCRKSMANTPSITQEGICSRINSCSYARECHMDNGRPKLLQISLQRK